jgi:hypothetical protein
MIKTILYEDGVQTVIVFDPDIPLWSQEIKVVKNDSEDTNDLEKAQKDALFRNRSLYNERTS